MSISKNIPGSFFSYTADSQHIFLSREGEYRFVYWGTGEGPTTVTVESFINDIQTLFVSYTDIPTTTNTLDNFAIQSSVPGQARIFLDTDGDGRTDDLIPSDGTDLTIEELLALIRDKVTLLPVKEKLKNKILKKVEKLGKRF